MIRSTFNSTTRRSVLAGGAAIGATGLLAACGGSSDSDSGGTSAPATTGSSPTAGSGSDALAATSEVPVGGGKIFSDQKVVVTQPTAGDFKGFSAVCTHQGCLVSSVADGEIACACHNSHFSASDGSVVSGPAQRALPAVTVNVQNDQITLG
jgi:Rieske Fe-S protein